MYKFLIDMYVRISVIIEAKHTSYLYSSLQRQSLMGVPGAIRFENNMRKLI